MAEKILGGLTREQMEQAIAEGRVFHAGEQVTSIDQLPEDQQGAGAGVLRIHREKQKVRKMGRDR